MQNNTSAAVLFSTLLSLFTLAVGVLPSNQAYAQNFRKCWSDPAAKSLTEMATVISRSGEKPNIKGAVLMLSNGDIRDLKTGFGAGLLLGWERTGRRPEFAGVTSVGVSNLIAPYAFLGVQGDPMIANIYNCNAGTPEQMAERAAHYMTPDVMALIAQKHLAGGKLLVGLPGSPGRAETVWDIGKIAASNHPDALENIRNILRASVSPVAAVDPTRVVAGGGKSLVRNLAFRTTGAGPAFLVLSDAGFKVRQLFVIENGIRYPEHSMDFARRQLSKPQGKSLEGLITGFELARRARSSRTPIQYASIRFELKFQRSKAYDIRYVRRLFDFAFRQGRRGEEWAANIPHLPRPFGRRQR